MALDAGVNFIDTAEMYAIPPRPETYGATEQIIGNWLSRNKEKRDKLVLATKMAGNGLKNHIRHGSDICPKTLVQAVEASLQRLNTDYIDLYQLHWPNRRSPHFGRHAVNHIPFSEVDARQQQDDILAILLNLS
ncbi:aldo/keto reductase [Alishewanella longhuensis]